MLERLQIEKNMQIKKITTHELQCSQHNQTKKRTANKSLSLYLFALWEFAAPTVFLICRCFIFYLHVCSLSATIVLNKNCFDFQASFINVTAIILIISYD